MIKHLNILFLLLSFFSLQSCGGEDYQGIELVEEPPVDHGIVISDSTSNKRDSIQGTEEQPSNEESTYTQGEKKYLIIEEYSSGIIKHQSAACYGDYAFFMLDGMATVQMYNMRQKQMVFTLSQKSLGQASIYHCNQSCFGKEKFNSEDPFPLLYVSMFQAGGRCSAFVFRILANWNTSINEYDSFQTELVQKIFYPKASDTNALYYVNAVLDTLNNCIYTYSNNSYPSTINYPKCQISKFPLPDAHSGNVVFEDKDIIESYSVDAVSANMQGGAIDNNMLYIGRGYPGAGYVNLYIIDLLEKRIKYNVDLLNNGFYEEPEGAFFYNGILYISTMYRRIFQLVFNSEYSSAKAITVPYDISE